MLALVVAIRCEAVIGRNSSCYRGIAHLKGGHPSS